MYVQLSVEQPSFYQVTLPYPMFSCQRDNPASNTTLSHVQLSEGQPSFYQVTLPYPMFSCQRDNPASNTTLSHVQLSEGQPSFYQITQMATVMGSQVACLIWLHRIILKPDLSVFEPAQYA